jgi:hypothetical protein
MFPKLKLYVYHNVKIAIAAPHFFIENKPAIEIEHNSISSELLKTALSLRINKRTFRLLATQL